MWLKSFFHKYFNCQAQPRITNSTYPTFSLKTASKFPRIIIIGAGAAGLTCAVKLRELGFKNILILEAENRIGGRILTKHFGDNVIDVGAQWVHGEYNNVVYGMIQKLNLLETSGELYQTFECIRSNGQTVNEGFVRHLRDIISQIFEGFEENLEIYEGSLDDYLNERFNIMLRHPDMKGIDPRLATEFFENFKKIESTETAYGLQEVSAKGYREFWQCPGDYLLNWKDKGYVTFLHTLLGSNENKPLGNLGDYIEFECHVDCIEWKRDDNQALVICNKGRKQFEADHVIITVSLGVLKQQMESMFNPPLPIPKKNAIVGLGFGSLAKIFLEFDHRFWPEDWYGFTTLWINEDLEELHKTTFDWVEEIFGFFCVKYQPRVLQGWMVGPIVLKIEKMSLEEVTKGCMYVLKRFLCKWEVPPPIDVAISKWVSNPNFAGTYSFRSMLSEELGATASLLAQPVTILVPFDKVPVEPCRGSSLCTSEADEVPTTKNKPILLFAGEATSSHHFSTVHGAVESGRREALRLLNYYGGSVNKLSFSL